jgi:hypothetical protein
MARLGFLIVVLAPIVLAITTLSGLIVLPHIAEHIADLLLGVELIVFSLLNARYELVRRWLKGLGWLGRPPFSLPTESKFGRVYYGSVTSVFALAVGLAWTFLPLMLLIHDLNH